MPKLKTETIGENISPRDINVQINKHKLTNKHQRYSRLGPLGHLGDLLNLVSLIKYLILGKSI